MEELKEKGNEAFKRGEHLEAYNLYTEAIKLATESNPNQKSQEEEEEEKVKQSEESEIIQKTTGLHLVYSNRATALLSLERYEEAIADCEKVFKLDPTFLKAYLRKAMALKALGKKKEALLVVKEGLAIYQQNKTSIGNSTGVPELTKLAQSLQGELNPKVVAKTVMKNKMETQDLLQDYRSTSEEVETLKFELESRQRSYQNLALTSDYLKNVTENQEGKEPSTYVPIGRMFIKTPSNNVKEQLNERLTVVKSEFDNLKGKMIQSEAKLQSLSGELEEILRQQQRVS